MTRKALLLDHIDASFLKQTMDHWGVPTTDIRTVLESDPKECSVVIFGGGTDIDPSIYGEGPGLYNQRPDLIRDRLEIAIYKWAAKNNVPMIGVCRGAQLLTALHGGKLIQHVTGHGGQDHETITKSQDVITMNSCHHQMMFPWYSSKEFEILAHTQRKQSKMYLGSGVEDVFKLWNIPDLFIRLEFVEPEIVWWPGSKTMCIQGHPEWMPEKSGMVRYINHMLERLVINESSGENCTTDSTQEVR